MTEENIRSVVNSMSREELVETVLVQARQIEKQTAKIEELTAKLTGSDKHIRDLEVQLEEARREGKRQAAPFRKPPYKRKPNPGKPGRKIGHPGSYRKPPAEIDESIEVPLSTCPCCGEDISGQSSDSVVQHIIEIPKVKPRVTRLVTYETTCRRCGETVQSTHPLKVSTATGAAGTHLGPNALAVACALNKGYGLTMRKTCRVLKSLFDLSLTPGGLSQAMDRAARRSEPNYRDHIDHLRSSPVVHVDETSWWVGGPKYWLHVFATPDTTVYEVADNRSRKVLHEMLGAHFPGVLVSDCLSIYDDASLLQHKCYAHHNKAIAEAALQARDHEFLGECRRLLHAAIALKAAQPSMPCDVFQRNREILEEFARDILKLPRSDPPAEKVRQRLLKQADHLFTFLYYDGVDATNNLAERQLRPAVIARKLSCGNKTTSGARTWSILTSIAATCSQRTLSFTDTIISALRLSR